MPIQGIILDIDGVIIGENVGINSPWPHPDVIQTLKTIREKGLPISLITAKPYFAVKKIIDDARLNNPHVTDGGSVVYDSIDQLIVEKHFIDPTVAQEVVQLFLTSDIYVEVYTIDTYYVQQNQVGEITKQHTQVLQTEPSIVPSLLAAMPQLQVTKIIPVVADESHIQRVEQIFKFLSSKVNLYWTVHPVALPLRFGIIVPFGISKTSGIQHVAQNLNIPFENLLGVGDSTSDWQFLQLCGYAVAMGNATQELKELVLTKGPENSYIAPSVDENGVLDVFKHFGIL